MRYIILTLHRDHIGAFEVNQTKVYQKGDYYRFVYFEPITTYLTPFRLEKIWLELAETTDGKLAGWVLIRSYEPAYASDKLLTELTDVERSNLAHERRETGLTLSGWVLDLVCYGVATKQEVSRLVRFMFATGYNMEQVIDVFSALTRRQELSRYFLQEVTKLYEGVTV